MESECAIAKLQRQIRIKKNQRVPIILSSYDLFFFEEVKILLASWTIVVFLFNLNMPCSFVTRRFSRNFFRTTRCLFTTTTTWPRPIIRFLIMTDPGPLSTKIKNTNTNAALPPTRSSAFYLDFAIFEVRGVALLAIDSISHSQSLPPPGRKCPIQDSSCKIGRRILTIRDYVHTSTRRRKHIRRRRRRPSNSPPPDREKRLGMSFETTIPASPTPSLLFDIQLQVIC